MSPPSPRSPNRSDQRRASAVMGGRRSSFYPIPLGGLCPPTGAARPTIPWTSSPRQSMNTQPPGTTRAQWRLSSSRATAPMVFPSSRTNGTAPASHSDVNRRRARRPAVPVLMLHILSALQIVSTKSGEAQVSSRRFYAGSLPVSCVWPFSAVEGSGAFVCLRIHRSPLLAAFSRWKSS